MHSPKAAPRSPWLIGYGDAKSHAVVGAVCLWMLAVALYSGVGNPSTKSKGHDFVQIYTIAHLAFEGDYPRLGDQARFHDRQMELVPHAQGRYFPVYAPTTALLFAPVRALSYEAALASWVVITLAVYGLIVWATWRTVRDVFPDGRFVAAAALAFPPLWWLVLFGQTTIVVIAALFLTSKALQAERPWMAGAALSLLSIKPQFGVLIVLILLLSRHWRVLSGAAAAVAIQGVAVALTMGSQALIAYADTVLHLGRMEAQLAPSPWRMHSLRTLTNLLPAWLDNAIFLILFAVVLALTARTWQSGAPLAARFGVLVLAAVLLNPHLFAYDASVLVLPLLLLGGWVERERPTFRTVYWHAVYLLFVLLLFPTATAIGLQISVLLMAWMFVALSTAIPARQVTPNLLPQQQQ